jgi:energy-coupling factor transporter ATP-binding protein EcfA2
MPDIETKDAAPSPFDREIDWSSAIKNRFLSKPGEHLLEIGITGSGKTQGLYHLLNGILDYSKEETILWITCGKSAEELKLMQFMPVNYLFPMRRSIEIKLYQKTYPYVSYEFSSIPNLFKHIDKKKINILCLAPYYPDPEEYAIVITELFRHLILIARNGGVPTPLAIFIDEFQMVAPARGQQLNEQHMLGGRWMQRNLDQLRSIGIRIVAAAQAWKKVLQGVRMSFGCIMIRQGAEFPSNELRRLAMANDKWQALGKEDMVFAFRNRFYSDVMRLPTYGDGYVVGSITYLDNTARTYEDNRDLDVVIDSYKKKNKRQKPDTEGSVNSTGLVFMC